MTENKNLNHTFSSDVNMPLYLYVSGVCIRLITVSLIEVFFSFFFFLFGGGGGGGAVVICSPYRRCENIISDVVRPSGCPFIF